VKTQLVEKRPSRLVKSSLRDSSSCRMVGLLMREPTPQVHRIEVERMAQASAQG
jgi:hypothetical protein